VLSKEVNRKAALIARLGECLAEADALNERRVAIAITEAIERLGGVVAPPSDKH
jgi:hypothetical protein